MTRGRCLAARLAILLLLVGGSAHADKIDDLGQQLTTAKDFRVRTQAALALGASKTQRAVKPLCGGLGDKSSTVRAASAAALGKLKKGGVSCLESRLAKEEVESVKALIRKAIARIEEADAPAITDKHKYYVIVETKDETGRADSSVAKLVHQGAETSIRALGEFVLAPRNQDDATAKALLQQHAQLQSAVLATRVSSTFSQGTLTVKLEVAIFTFPDKNLKGTFTNSVSMSGLSAKSEAAENELIQAAAERAVKTYSTQAHKIR